ncbi:aspartate aminotransferase family protein [Marinilongibacter aquaticus]|uniref:pyridoxal phosphate-dependent decarboxylase family protein n=1 Tax=Marinilongibacter aquaticus TaxID=2975157 RepID=UPI0021BD3437|nr:pyridoxal-dependent decarboxylase [Marinilongibacter aquaticus]UBM59805.1 aspartate aminotransferase family protein [Marinilongibacter aquaticus]
MKYWKKRTAREIQERIELALSQNRSFYDQPILGLPASHLDSRIFPRESPILTGAPFLQTLINNPNHIGCHTVTQSEETFAGTHDIERELLRMIACDIFKADEEEFDGYVASGGTEANIQAVWIYREFFRREYGAELQEIGLFTSVDTHYSISKASNLLNIPLYKIDVDEKNRQMAENTIEEALEKAKSEGIRYVIFIGNMMTTMFGSVDPIEPIVRALKASNLEYKLHYDCAYGGFYYPFANPNTQIDFSNPELNSLTIDAHKMVQAPYGTGIFLIRKGFMHYTHNKDASYVQGEDYTLVGSRSGANAIAVWMILSTYGKYGWTEKTFILTRRTDWLCEQLEDMDIEYFRQAYSNIVTIHEKYITPELAKKYYVVPDNHHQAKWYKLIIMDHVDLEQLEPFLKDLKELNFNP